MSVDIRFELLYHNSNLVSTLSSYGKKKRFRFICLNDSVVTVMAYANDVTYNSVFVEQLINFLAPGDVVIGISGSGNFENVLRAIEYANANGAVTIGIVGYNGGKLKLIAQNCVHINIDNMQIYDA